MMKKPLFIVFEGIDGSGKTTQAKMLDKYLNENGIKCMYRHIFDSSAGELLRDIFIRNSFSNTVEILILCATRQSFFDEVLQNSKEYDVVIIDRLFLSILAMQGKSDKDVNLIYFIMEYIGYKSEEFYIYYMETTPQECKNRICNKLSHDRIEEKSIEFHTKVFERYKRFMLKEVNVSVFQGNNSINNVHKEIVEKTIKLLEK